MARNTQQDIVDFLRKNPGYYSETELIKQCFGYDRNSKRYSCESNKKYADLLRRAWVGNHGITRRVKAGTTARYEWFLVTDSDSEKKNFPELLENRNNGQTFTLTNSNNINTQNMENTSITTATVNAVQSCISSIFSNEDVLNLLEQQKAEILASIPKPESTTQISWEVLLKVASAVISTFEQSIDDGLRNTDFQDIVNECDIEIGYDRRIELCIDNRSASQSVNEAIGYELPDSEVLADLIRETLKEAQSESVTETTEPEA